MLVLGGVVYCGFLWINFIVFGVFIFIPAMLTGFFTGCSMVFEQICSQVRESFSCVSIVLWVISLSVVELWITVVSVIDVEKLWEQCVSALRLELSMTDQEYHTWIAPLHITFTEGKALLLAPNHFVSKWISDRYLSRIDHILRTLSGDDTFTVCVDVLRDAPTDNKPLVSSKKEDPVVSLNPSPPLTTADVSKSNFVIKHVSGLNPKFTFDNFVEGKSNQLAKAAALQVGENPGLAYNPLFCYGGVGLGKTHLMQAIGSMIQANKKDAQVVYLHSERFVADMVKALQSNAINEFKQYYRSVDALLIDDIQFFAGKDRSQEEFFHTFNSLLEGHQQIIMTCDRYPKEIDGLEERLKSRFGWGLTVAIDPPELETRVAILINKARLSGITLEHEVAFFIAKRIRSNVRELEGALRRVIANANFTGKPITIEFVKEALKDLITLQDRLITMDNIQRTVAGYFKIKVADLLSKRRNRSVARPRQIAMSLAKELTNHSLPEIGEAFGGRDHTTVLHACRTIQSMRNTHPDIAEDYINLLRILTT